MVNLLKSDKNQREQCAICLRYCIQLWIRPVLFSPCRDLRLIRPVLNSPSLEFNYISLLYYSIHPVLNSPSDKRAKFFLYTVSGSQTQISNYLCREISMCGKQLSSLFDLGKDEDFQPWKMIIYIIIMPVLKHMDSKSAICLFVCTTFPSIHVYYKQHSTSDHFFKILLSISKSFSITSIHIVYASK